MARLGQLREQAKALGIPGRLIRGAETAAELQSVIEDHKAHENGQTAPRKKSRTKKVVRKASQTRTAPRKKASKPKVKPANSKKRNVVATKSTGDYSKWGIPKLKAELASRGISAGRGRPSQERYAALLEADDAGTRPKVGRKPKSTPKARTTPVKRSKAPVQKSTTKRKVTKPHVESTNGRHIIGDVDFNETDGWNPRPGSAPDRIIKALKKKRGNREAAFKLLLPKVGDFVAAKKQDGKKRSKDEMEAMLRYRISRTLWDFAMRTGQHEASDERAEYGTAGTGEGTFKPAKQRVKAPTRTVKKKSTTTRKPTRTQKAKATKATSNNYSRMSISRLKKELASRGISAGRGRPSEARYAALLEADDAKSKKRKARR